jgi:hypothetical protein
MPDVKHLVTLDTTSAAAGIVTHVQGRCTCGTTITAGSHLTFDQAVTHHLRTVEREGCKQRHPAYADLPQAAQS